MEMNAAIEKELLDYVSQQAGEDWGPLTSEEELVESGILDSRTIVVLAKHLETTYGIRVEDAEIAPENFGSVTLLTRFVARKRGA